MGSLRIGCGSRRKHLKFNESSKSSKRLYVVII